MTASEPPDGTEGPAEGLLGPDEIAFRLELTASQMKIVHTALHSLFDDLGRDQHDVKTIVSEVLDKLPGDHDIRAIDISRRPSSDRGGHSRPTDGRRSS